MANLISIGQLIDQTWEHYSVHFKKLMKISAWAFILPTLVIIRTFLIPEGENAYLVYVLGGFGTAKMIISLIIGLLLSVVAVPVITMFIYINLVKAIESQHNRKPTSFKEIRQYGWKVFWSYLWVAILKAFFNYLPLLLLVPGLTLIFTNIYYNGGTFWGAVSNLVMLIGIVAALILVVMLGVKLGFASFERLIAEKRGMLAVKESYKLVTGRFWKTFWRIFVTKIVFGIGMALLNIVAILILLGLEYGLSPLSYMETTIVSALSTYMQTGVMVLVFPIFVVVDYILYDSLTKSK